MKFTRLIGASLLGASLLAGCGGSSAPTPIVSVPTFAPLGASAAYWDLGVSVKYPANWIAPLYGSGQMLLAPSAESTAHNPPTDPLVALQVATLDQLHLTKEATLAEITTLVSGKNTNTVERAAGKAGFAGLDASFIDLQDTKNNLYEQTIAFRMPDGRIGWLIAVTPFDLWADFAPSFDSIRASGVILKPAAYPMPKLTGSGAFAQGGLTFSLPEGWLDKDLGGGIHQYHHQADAAYQDGSGFANGPQLVLRARPLESGKSLSDSLVQMIGASSSKPVAISVGGQPGAQLTITAPSTGQLETFIAVASQDKTVMNVFRWTTPAPLAEVTRPLLDGILESVTFGSITATLVPVSTQGCRNQPAAADAKP